MASMPTHIKYQKGYFLPPEPCYDWVRRDAIDRAPTWCSVDLRDGNQALVVPMSLEEKLEFFQLLVRIGFKEIEVGFPAASETEFEFCRALIERGLIPDDVTIQVLTQAREHIIRRTFDALEGCTTPVIVHVYNSTSLAQREQVFHASRDEVKRIAVEGAKLLKRLADEALGAVADAQGGEGAQGSEDGEGAEGGEDAHSAEGTLGAGRAEGVQRADRVQGEQGAEGAEGAQDAHGSERDAATAPSAPSVPTPPAGTASSAPGTPSVPDTFTPPDAPSVTGAFATPSASACSRFRFEYSPESFTGTEPTYALEVCNAVLDVWRPTPERRAIINLPATVEMSSPHVYAQQVEYLHKHLNYRDAIDLSLHPHNDRGTGVACAELGVLAGADRVEGTLFGNGERTGNVDIVTLAMNLFSHGVDPALDLHDLPRIVALYERVTGMEVEPRRPYAGQLVFAAFSGSHQDAIAKGLAYRELNSPDVWTCPYLPIDPADVSRRYESDVIRINSQSGKGGIGYILERNFGYVIPPRLREELSYRSKGVSDEGHRELAPDEVNVIFHDEYVNRVDRVKLLDFHFSRSADNLIFTASALFDIDGETESVFGQGNGRLNAVVDALRKVNISVHVEAYSEHALDKGSASRAAAYVGITDATGSGSGSASGIVWGVGEHHDIITASIRGLISAVNRQACGKSPPVMKRY